ncbi:glycosyltransferase family 4 protein [Aquabacterium sp.]|uniref:glycosyltransferase family 4 protein n=1 Tax=Aquabacterium sp. TaxID=1872578 RepID=UPI00248867A8|nr:glycosyltransferase family 4 protein [Aquabacterium sp.]MDI1259313.1 glycosyltransferase family 4 protein [Aquabacterium sp.]
MSRFQNPASRRICFVAPYLGGNGKALYWGALFEGLVAGGMAVEVLTGPRFDRGECPSIVQNDTVSFRRILGVTIPSPYVVVSLLKLKCDAMLILEFSILALVATVLARLKGQTRSILLVENAPQFTSAKRGGVFKWLRKIQCRLCTGILTNNAKGFEYLVSELGVDPSKITAAVYLTSSLAGAALPLKPDVRGRTIKFACIGRLIPEKGFMELVDEVALLSESEKERLEIDVFGAGPLMSVLQNKINGERLSDVIRLNGNIPYAELGTRLGQADAFIMPTLGDYRSLASFEALSLGLPLLISVHDGAHSEVLGDGGSGVLIDPLLRGSMAGAIQDILKHPEKLEVMRRNALNRAQAFTVEKAVSNIAMAVEKATLRGQGSAR